MRAALIRIQLMLLGAGIILAVLWVREPDRHYDAWLGVSVAVLALLEFVKRKVEEPHDKEKQKELIEQAMAKGLTTYDDAKRIAAEQDKLRAAQDARERERPIVDPLVEKYKRIVGFRLSVESKIREYAKLCGIEESAKTPSELLTLLPLDDSWKKGIEYFLKTTDDLGHEAPAMVDWATSNGDVYVRALDLVIGNRKKALQEQVVP